MKLTFDTKKYTFRKTLIFLVLIIFLGFLIRVVNIQSNSLYGDELTMVYDIYSILKTGHDQTGEFLPLTFKMGAGRPAGYIYASVPFVYIFGPTALGVRMLSLLSGVGIIFLAFLIGRKIFSSRIGLITAALVALSPWSISISGGGFEATFALFLALLGVTFYLYSEKTNWFYIAAAVCWGITLHTYPTYKLVLPLFILLLVWFLGGFPRNRKKLGWFSSGGVVLVLFCLLVVFQTLSRGSEERFLSLNVFSEQETRTYLAQKINNDRLNNQLPNSLSVLFHNRPVEYIQVLFNSYIQNFSPEYLFIRGDKNPRHNMAAMGAFYIIDLFFVIAGLIYLIKRKLNKVLGFLIGWLLVSPLATSFLIQTHFLRSAFMIVPFLLIVSLGIVYLWDLLKGMTGGRIIKFGLIVLFVVQFFFLVNNLLFLSPYKFSGFWAEPAYLAAMRAINQKESFDYVIISTRIDNIEYAYPVYNNIDPVTIQRANREKVNLNGYSFKKFDNVYIGSIPDTLIENFMDNLNGKILYIGARWEQPYLQNYTLVTGKDHQVAYIELKK